MLLIIGKRLFKISSMTDMTKKDRKWERGGGVMKRNDIGIFLQEMIDFNLPDTVLRMKLRE